jgi:hypothetical protein
MSAALEERVARLERKVAELERHASERTGSIGARETAERDLERRPGTTQHDGASSQ